MHYKCFAVRWYFFMASLFAPSSFLNGFRKCYEDTDIHFFPSSSLPQAVRKAPQSFYVVQPLPKKTIILQGTEKKGKNQDRIHMAIALSHHFLLFQVWGSQRRERLSIYAFLGDQLLLAMRHQITLTMQRKRLAEMRQKLPMEESWRSHALHFLRIRNQVCCKRSTVSFILSWWSWGNLIFLQCIILRTSSKSSWNTAVKFLVYIVQLRIQSNNK